MSYSNDRNFGDWVAALDSKGHSVVSSINEGEIEYRKWYALSYGLTDAEIAALPQFTGRTEADITKIRYAMGALHDLYTALNGTGSVVSRDRQSDLIFYL